MACALGFPLRSFHDLAPADDEIGVCGGVGSCRSCDLVIRDPGGINRISLGAFANVMVMTSAA